MHFPLHPLQLPQLSIRRALLWLLAITGLLFHTGCAPLCIPSVRYSPPHVRAWDGPRDRGIAVSPHADPHAGCGAEAACGAEWSGGGSGAGCGCGASSGFRESCHGASGCIQAGVVEAPWPRFHPLPTRPLSGPTAPGWP